MELLEAHPVHIQANNVRTLANVLQAIKYSAKQARCGISTLSPHGSRRQTLATLLLADAARRHAR